MHLSFVIQFLLAPHFSALASRIASQRSKRNLNNFLIKNHNFQIKIEFIYIGKVEKCNYYNVEMKKMQLTEQNSENIACRCAAIIIAKPSIHFSQCTIVSSISIAPDDNKKTELLEVDFPVKWLFVPASALFILLHRQLSLPSALNGNIISCWCRSLTYFSLEMKTEIPIISTMGKTLNYNFPSIFLLYFHLDK